jgi:hypothetical protein
LLERFRLALYGFSVFNLKPRQEDDYPEYNLRAGRIACGLGGRVIAAGDDPICELHDDAARRLPTAAGFPGEAAFRRSLDQPERDSKRRRSIIVGQ